MNLLENLKPEELKDKKVLLRVDFNVSVDDAGNIDDFRVKAHRDTVSYLVEHGAKVVIVAHIDAPLTSFETIKDKLIIALGRDFFFSPFSPDASKLLDEHSLVLMDNIRQDPREVENDPAFARQLAQGFDLYVNDAFAVAHRGHTSVSAITEFLPSYCGLLMKKETDILTGAINAPKEGKVIIIGGAKISTKLPVIKNFLDKAEKILIGGALANDFFKAQGFTVGVSLVDETAVPEVDPQIVALPHDIVITRDKTGLSGDVEASVLKNIESDQVIADIGPQTAELFAEIIQSSKMVIWNGPMGLSEAKSFAKGTEIVAAAVASASQSIIGGGDTIAALSRLNLLDKMSFVSTGGGAMLAFLGGEKLPGLEALGYY